MIEDVRKLLDDYTRWLRDKTVLEEVNDRWVKITTPHLDRHNDYLQIFVKQEDNGYLLSDDGYVIQDLENSGCKLDSPKRQELLHLTLAGFGVGKDEDILQMRATKDNFNIKKHNLIQAMLAVNDLFYLAQPTIKSLFFEDVSNWFDLVDVRFTPRVKFAGKTGYDHMFDFAIPKSRKQPERIIQTVNNPRRDKAESLAFKWIDTKETRQKDSKLYAFLNDREHDVSSDVIEALRSYELTPVLWSEREEVQEELAA